MLIASIPTKIPTPFADSAGAGFTRPIPNTSQIGIQAGAASFPDGFPPVCFLPIGAGGTPPWGADFNGLLNQMSAWLRWTQAGAPIAYDATFQTNISGYPLGAVVASAVTPGLYWYNTTDGNTTNPDASGAGWTPVALGSGGVASTGDWKWRPTQETLPGWTKANATTIGDASSNATQLADPTAAAQFAWLWGTFSNTQCPVLTSAGAPVARGSSAAADFAAHRQITVLDMRGIGPLGMDTMGGAPTTRLTGVPATSGSATQSGSVLGENLHALITAELAVHAHGTVDAGHNHAVSDPGHLHGTGDPTHSHSASASGVGIVTGSTFAVAGGTGFGAVALTIGNSLTNLSVSVHLSDVTNVAALTGLTISNAGSGTQHNTTQLSMTGTHYFKL